MSDSLQPPDFVRTGGVDAVAEFSTFSTAVGEVAAHLLAELAELHNYGAQSDIPLADVTATTVVNLYCRRIKDWAVFYTTAQPWRLIVIHVGHINPHSFSSLESEATNRLRRLAL